MGMGLWVYALKMITDLLSHLKTKPKPTSIETPKKSTPKTVPSITTPVSKPIESPSEVVTPVPEEDATPVEVIDNTIKLTTSDLHSLGVTTERANKFITPLNNTLVKYKINTPLRISHFIAQLLHESGNLKYMEEIASGSAYEGRKDLGNTYSGDGVKYKGRGLLQLTGRLAYKKYSDVTGINFIDNPTELAIIENACDSAGWFWEVWKKNKYGHNLNVMADEDDFLKVTYFVNGGYNGLKHRFNLLRIAYGIFRILDGKDRLDKIITSINENLSKTTRTPREKALFLEIPNKETLEKLSK